ncbi:MAG: HD domain-containing protein [Candidatus Neomarinimicrobiota bacterium]
MKLDLDQILENDPRIAERIRQISAVADKNGIPAFLVGGFVRDLLLGIPCKDLDIMVLGDGPDFADHVSDALALYPVIKYERFGTAMIPMEDMALEIVSARKEVYRNDSRKPKVESADLDQDLMRRDFTINAMAISINSEKFGNFIDPFHGLRDMKENRILTPMDPELTFFEDPLRMLRAIRFATRFSFQIEKNTFQAIGKHAERIRIVSWERIRDEFLKILNSNPPSQGMTLLYESGLMQVLFPEIAALQGVETLEGHRHKDVFDHTLKVLDNIAAADGDLHLRLAALFHDIAKPECKRFVPENGWTFHGHEDAGARMFEHIGKKLRLPTRDIKRISKLIRLHLRPIAVAGEGVTDSAVRRLMVESGEDINALLTLCRADITSKNKERVRSYRGNFEKLARRISEVEEKDKLRAFQSPLDGTAIMRIFQLKPGPQIGRIKHHIEEAILEGEIANTREAAEIFVEKNKEKLIDLYLRND